MTNQLMFSSDDDEQYGCVRGSIYDMGTRLVQSRVFGANQVYYYRYDELWMEHNPRDYDTFLKRYYNTKLAEISDFQLQYPPHARKVVNRFQLDNRPDLYPELGVSLKLGTGQTEEPKDANYHWAASAVLGNSNTMGGFNTSLTRSQIPEFLASNPSVDATWYERWNEEYFLNDTNGGLYYYFYRLPPGRYSLETTGGTYMEAFNLRDTEEYEIHRLDDPYDNPIYYNQIDCSVSPDTTSRVNIYLRPYKWQYFYRFNAWYESGTAWDSYLMPIMFNGRFYDRPPFYPYRPSPTTWITEAEYPEEWAEYWDHDPALEYKITHSARWSLSAKEVYQMEYITYCGGYRIFSHIDEVFYEITTIGHYQGELLAVLEYVYDNNISERFGVYAKKDHFNEQTAIARGQFSAQLEDLSSTYGAYASFQAG